MPRIRLEAVLGATDSSHALVIGIADGGSVRVRAQVPHDLGIVIAVMASYVGPMDFDVPDEAVISIEEIEPGAE